MKPTVKNLVISDFDMTFFNFKEVDNKIIATIFKKHPFILFIDNLLWYVNSLGIIGNSMGGLKLRFIVYSILSGFRNHISYSEIFTKYEFMYKNLVYKKYKRKIWIIKGLENKGYTFRILTNNRFAAELNMYDIIYTKNKGKFLKETNPEYLLGDNYWDDYRNCPKCTKYINVGNGILSKLHLKNITCIKNMYEIFKVL